ncbi:hypothetical protein AGMMS4956_02180 [Bacteroidia bacterium]|nr:hypothetical protein AGMMS4956_02180 [Bacteroidia bacterium]
MKKILMILVAVIGLGLTTNAQLFAKKKTIIVSPSTAKIYVNGSEVGNGTYVLNMKDDIAILKFINPGYYDKEVKLLKDDPRKTLQYSLDDNDEERNSLGGEAALNANKWVTITVKKGLTEDIVWKRLMSAVQRNFEEIELRDKSAGTIRTQWVSQKFNIVTVRTRLEIRPDFSQDDLTYQVKLSSEIKWNNQSNEGYKKHDRVLKKYENVISEIQATVAGGN